MHDSYNQKISILKGKLIWNRRGVNSVKAWAIPRLVAYIAMSSSSLLPFLHAELSTDRNQARRFDKRVDKLNIGVKI